MKNQLEMLSTFRLTHMEAGQLNNRLLNDLGTIDPVLKTDAPFNNYYQLAGEHSELYARALAQIRKNEDTLKIANADHNRDKALKSFRMALKLHLAALDAEEAEIARSISVLFSAYKNADKLNYEAESLAIDKLISELNSETYGPKINSLHMQKYVSWLGESNAIFKNLFSQRLLDSASTEVFDMKTVRKAMLKNYEEFCNYVLAMANATSSPLFINSLGMINAARKYYADMLARRKGGKDSDEEQPSTD